MNPYYNQGFLSFFLTLFGRILGYFDKTLAYPVIAQDEMQIIVLTFVSISGCLIGSHLIYRKLTMVANSISHTILLGIVCAWLLYPEWVIKEGSFSFSSVPLVLAAVAMGLFTTYLIGFFKNYALIAEDASISVVFTTLFALGILLITLFAKNSHLGVEAILGNADALSLFDVYLSFGVCLASAFFTALFFKELMAGSFDLSFAKSILPSSKWIHFFLLTLLSVVVVAGFRAVGVLLVLAFIVLPPHIALIFVRSYKGMLLLSSALSFAVVLFSVAMTRALLSDFGVALSTGGVTVTLLFTLYLICLSLFSSSSSFFHKRGV